MTTNAAKQMQIGDTIDAPYVKPDPNRRGEYVAEMQPGKVLGFSHDDLAARTWGWRGEALVEFPDGHRVWMSAGR